MPQWLQSVIGWLVLAAIVAAIYFGRRNGRAAAVAAANAAADAAANAAADARQAMSVVVNASPVTGYCPQCGYALDRTTVPYMLAVDPEQPSLPRADGTANARVSLRPADHAPR